MSDNDALGLEKKLWMAADKLRSNMDAAVYKHVVLGLIFLKYISDSFEELYQELRANPEADEEDEDEYLAERVFWVPKNARWGRIKENARKSEIGLIIDESMIAIEKCNTSLRGVLPKDYSRPTLNKVKLGELVDLISTIGFGNEEYRGKDLLGRVYEYFLGQFASAEGKKGGQFYTPRSIVELLVSMLRPMQGRVYDPCCGSGGMFVLSKNFVEAQGGKIDQISIYGQESNDTTWRLAKMNLAMRNIKANLGEGPADTFTKDLHDDMRADFIIANPPFNMNDWGQPNLLGNKRWVYSTPPKGNANYAWLQHMIFHLSPNGMAGIVLANGSLSAKSVEGEIRREIINADLLDCVIALPDKLFYNTAIPCCLWLFSKNKAQSKFRSRNGETLFIDAREMGNMLVLPDGKISRKQRELSEENMKKISDTYLSWRGDSDVIIDYRNEAGFCFAADKEEIVKHNYVITPGRYVGAPIIEDEEGAFEDNMRTLTSEIQGHIERAGQLEGIILKGLEEFSIDN